MNAKRPKYTLTTSIKEEVLPVIIHDPNGLAGETHYAYTYATEEEAQVAVAALGGHTATLGEAQEIIIDENGHPVTIHQLVSDDGHTLEEVEQVESDGEHTYIQIVQHTEEHLSEGELLEHNLGVDGAAANRAKTFYCPNCGNCYSAAGSLKLHMRACLRKRIEVPAEDRRCTICNKIFNSVSYLKEHMMRHTGEGPRRCTRCYRKFVDDDKFRAHVESHKQQDKLDAEAEALAHAHGGKKVVVKEFTCSFCSQNFTVVFEEGQVKRRYACDTCREKYSNAEMLKKHKQEVDDKREFACERCGRKFVFEGFLQRHMPNCDGTIKRRRDMK